MAARGVVVSIMLVACSGTSSGPKPGAPAGDMIPIAAARIELGCRGEGGGQCKEAGAYATAVEVAGFEIDRTEVTVASYRACVMAAKCTPLREPPKLGDRMPALVDWDQADAFCRWRGARLPREAEWELAARGTDGRAYPWGADAPTCADVRYPSACDRSAESIAQSAGMADVATHPKDRSPFGVMDMAGNAPEWVAEPYTAQYEPDLEMLEPAQLERRVVRGETGMQGPPCCPIYARTGQDKTLRMGGTTHNRRIGFRCVRSAGAAKQ